MATTADMLCESMGAICALWGEKRKEKRNAIVDWECTKKQNVSRFSVSKRKANTASTNTWLKILTCWQTICTSSKHNINSIQFN